MLYYQYDPLTAIYLGPPQEALESPEEPGVFHLPAFATFDPVQEFLPEGKVPRRVNGEWILVDLPPVVPEVIEPSFDDEASNLHVALQGNILGMAMALGFADTVDALRYGGQDSQKGYDSTDFSNWKNACEAMFSSVIASRNLPTVAELFAMMPKLVRRTWFAAPVSNTPPPYVPGALFPKPEGL